MPSSVNSEEISEQPAPLCFATINSLGGDISLSTAMDSGSAQAPTQSTIYQPSQPVLGACQREPQVTGSIPRRITTTFLSFPSELVDNVLSFLDPVDLAAVSATCHPLRKYAISDHHWQRIIQRHLPPVTFLDPGPCRSYRHLYIAHERRWFLPQNKLWFCDRDLTGKLVVVRFDHRRGCIEGYQLLAVNKSAREQSWTEHPEVLIHDFEPELKLHLDKPILRFGVPDEFCSDDSLGSGVVIGSADELPMLFEDRLPAMRSTFLLTRPLDADDAQRKLLKDYPYDAIWPPPAVPASQRVSGARSSLETLVDLPFEDRPRTRAEICHKAFRIRQWMQMGANAATQAAGNHGDGFEHMIELLRNMALAGRAVNPGLGVHIGEEIVTYSSLEPWLYTPTIHKPWRGIWVGDYSGHGCEFLLIHQPDDSDSIEGSTVLEHREDEMLGEWDHRSTDARVYRGSMEGIKLTGDPNVPRGERSFVVDDLGPGGWIGNAVDPPFSGAKIVRSRGHVAFPGFHRDEYIHGQLLLLSHDCLAQYWEEYRHVSYFHRVDIDAFLKT